MYRKQAQLKVRYDWIIILSS